MPWRQRLLAQTTEGGIPQPLVPRHPKAPKVQPSGADGVPIKAIRLAADSTQTTRIAGDLDEK
jgi:hypothetical protein